MRRTVHIDELREHIVHAQRRLIQDKEALFDSAPAERVKNREEYAFCYVRAERFGTRAILQALAHFNWMPLQVDPTSEMLGKNRAPLNRWIHSYAIHEPDAVDFGNDFMHVLARVGMRSGWDSQEFFHAALSIAKIFRDLSCLLNAAFFLTWFENNKIETVAMSLSGDLVKTVADMARIIENPGLYVVPHKSLDHRTKSRHKASSQKHKVKRPHLRVISKTADPKDSGLSGPSH